MRKPPLALKPRAVAVMVVLRGGALAARTVRSRISDVSLTTTGDLLGDMRTEGMIALVPGGLWTLTAEGWSWLQRHGLGTL